MCNPNVSLAFVSFAVVRMCMSTNTWVNVMQLTFLITAREGDHFRDGSSIRGRLRQL